MKKGPKVSVLMLVYNAAGFIRESVQSMLDQTFSDFELIIIDDSSTDDTVKILETFRDERIQLYKKQTNKGLTDSLISGLPITRGQYIARMDGDDIAMPERLQKQVQFMDNHPDVICCGTNYTEMPSGKKSQMFCSDNAIRLGLLDNSQFAHPTVMLRKDPITRHNIWYNREWELAEDYKLWTDLAPFGKFANLPESLLKYRVHSNQYSSARAAQQKEKAEAVALLYTKKLSGHHPKAAYFQQKIFSDITSLRKYELVEREILLNTGVGLKAAAHTFLRERKKRILQHTVRSRQFLSLFSLKLLISYPRSFGPKFYFSLLTKQRSIQPGIQ